MDVAAITTAGTGSTASSRASIGETFDNFLTLLTTQLRYQDPVSPLDTNEFTNQLVQFSQVEQMIRSNDKLDDLLALVGSNRIGFAASLTGREVELTDDGIAYDGARPVRAGYSLPPGTVGATVRVLDGRGTTVFSATADTAAGRHAFVWNGSTDRGGSAAAGLYRLQVSGRDADGNAVIGETSVVRRVTGVDIAGGELNLEFDGGGTAPLSEVLAIREAPTSAAAS